MDRAPKKPPFQVGTRLRQIGDRQSWAIDPDTHERIPLEARGLEVTICETRLGERGTLRPIPAQFQEDDGSDPILDTTRDGYSVYRVGPKHHGRIIRADTAHEWEVVR